ncbi:hypothetical protein [Pseudorhodobacter antarcticus]|jgi:hypothetical protein|uniref:hypothetical protein n=1 Tax=Pseudorhodobacter antarcticus TaxID=1077947 RepID=UPI00067BD582|nr:hypothetical protein [Pseudorhodobacter antarcticus]
MLGFEVFVITEDFGCGSSTWTLFRKNDGYTGRSMTQAVEICEELTQFSETPWRNNTNNSAIFS